MSAPEGPRIRPATAGDHGRILALNTAEVEKTSAMDASALQRFSAMADLLEVAVDDGAVAGFLLALRETAPYRNDNFEWFRSRYPCFLYVDRIVVDAAHGGRGIGAALYRRLFDKARADGVPVVVCEFNLVPPNPGSAAFHARFGFVEVGRRNYPGSERCVSMQASPLASNSR